MSSNDDENNTPDDNDHDDDNNKMTMTTSGGAEKILELLKSAGVSTENLEEKKHAFWDTQVR